MPPLFNKLLIANRGEIACRVIRTAKRLGIRTVAIYSEPDALTPHVAMADEAVCLGGISSADSYLRVDKVLAAMKATGANAVHPGYGFLSENAGFSKAVKDFGAAFVGPDAHAIDAMGDKIESKRLAGAAGVSIIPGIERVLKDAEEAVAVANEVGYPVMLKASAGGGGKGMRIAYTDEEAREGFKLSAAEAISSFGDDRIFVERYVESPRHIEIQLIADQHGNCVYLPPRECSIQRRNQKVVEEAPAVNLSDETIRKMGEEAVSLAKAVGYSSAGTVEYLVDAQQRHYFLEMNTRLQVEHPVTEEVTGLDLVELMLGSAAGLPLPITQADVLKPRGWSFECRIYAEDPLRGFLPSVGTLSTYSPPDTATCVEAAAAEAGDGAEPAGHVRVDAGIVEGGEISVHYDPMISKLITHGPTRDVARLLMLQALDRYAIRGVRHNINFCRDLLAHPRFASGALTTAFIPEEFPDGYSGHVLSPSERADLLACASALQYAHLRRWEGLSGGSADQDSVLAVGSLDGGHRIERTLHVGVTAAGSGAGDGLALGEAGEAELEISVRLAAPWIGGAGSLLPADAVLEVEARPVPAAGGAEAAAAAEAAVQASSPPVWTRELRLLSSGLGPGGLMEVRFQPEGRPMAVQVVERKALGWSLSAFGTTYEVLARSPSTAAASLHMKPPPRSALDDALLSPMPGTLLSVNVSPGDPVFEGKELCVIEAMKMQNVMHATRDGVVKAILAEPGSTLAADQPILTFEEPEPEAQE